MAKYSIILEEISKEEFEDIAFAYLEEKTGGSWFSQQTKVSKESEFIRRSFFQGRAEELGGAEKVLKEAGVL